MLPCVSAGCMRDLRLSGRYVALDGQPRDGVSRVSSQGLSVGCTTDSCKKNPCSPPLTCIDLWRVHECRYCRHTHTHSTDTYSHMHSVRHTHTQTSTHTHTTSQYSVYNIQLLYLLKSSFHLPLIPCHPSIIPSYPFIPSLTPPHPGTPPPHTAPCVISAVSPLYRLIL